MQMQVSDEKMIPPEPDPPAPSELETIATYAYPYQAEIARGRLESEGIPAFLADEFLINLNWLYTNAIGGIRLRVAADDALLAREILAQVESGQDLLVDAESE
jgi:hypothetical protein